MRSSIVTATVLLSSLLTQPLAAQKEQPPAGGEPRDFVLPAAEIYSLANGLQVVLVPYGTVPKATLQLVVRVGNINEGPDQIWLADLVGEFLKEGTQTLGAGELAQKAADMGGEIEISVSADETDLQIEVLSEFSLDALALLADLVQNPSFPEPELERLKGNLVRQLSLQKSNPSSMAIEKFREVLYREHPYGRIFPTEAMLQSYSRALVQDFYATNFGASRSQLFVVGQFDSDQIRTVVEERFKNWVAGPSAYENIPKTASHRAIHLVDRPGAQQSNLLIGLPVIPPNHPDYVPLQVTNTLLGGFFSSRITANIREDKGYTYSPNSSISSRYRDAYWVQSAAVSTEVTGPSVKEILYEIERLSNQPPSSEELEGVKNYLSGVFVLQNSSRSGIINLLSFLNLHGLSSDYLTQYVNNVHAVTPDQVTQLVQKYIRTDDLTIVCVGDKSQILDQIQVYGEIVE